MDLPRARKILNVANSAFISMDEQGVITYWNIRAEETFGVSREQAVGRNVIELIVPERYREPLREGFRRHKAGGRTRLLDTRTEQRAVRADGSEFPIELIVSAIDEEQGLSFHAFITDISERKAQEAENDRLLRELESALAGSEQRLRAIVDSLAEAITIRGRDNHLIYANRAALARMEIESVQELARTDPQSLMEGHEVRGEDGGAVGIDDLPSVRLLRGEEPEPLLLQTVKLDNGEEHWVLLKAAPVRDADGEIDAAVTIIEDVTVRQAAAAAQRVPRARGDAARLLARLRADAAERRHAGGAVAGRLVRRRPDRRGGPARAGRGRAHRPGRVELAARLREYEPEQMRSPIVASAA